MSDLILEKYNRAMSDSLASSLETERIIRISSIDLDNGLIQEQTEIETLEDPYADSETAERLKKIALKGGTAYAKGYAKRKARNAARKAYVAKVKPVLEKGLKTLGLTKYIPALGSLIALLSLSFNVYQLLKETKVFTSKLLKYSGVELSGVRSLLGQYSIFDASAEDMTKISEALSENLTEAQRKDLRTSYNKVLEESKEVILDILLSIKDFTLEAAIPIAVAVHLTPGERILKDVFFKAHKTINDLMNSIPGPLRALFSILSLGPSMLNMPVKLTPLIGFLGDKKRIIAFAKIDEVIDTPRPAIDRFEDVVDYSGKKVGGLDQDMDDFASNIAAGITL